MCVRWMTTTCFVLWKPDSAVSAVLLSDGLRVFHSPSVYLIFTLQLNEVVVLVAAPL